MHSGCRVHAGEKWGANHWVRLGGAPSGAANRATVGAAKSAAAAAPAEQAAASDGGGQKEQEGAAAAAGKNAAKNRKKREKAAGKRQQEANAETGSGKTIGEEDAAEETAVEDIE